LNKIYSFNTSAIGTKLRAKAIIDSQPVWQLRQVSGQTGFNAQNSFNVEFGFADAFVVDSIEIIWPEGTVDIYDNIEVNKFYKATEGQGFEEIIVTSVENNFEVLNEYILFNNYPNPFNPVTTISYSLPLKSQVELVIYNALGESVTQLVNEEKEAGKYSFEFDAKSLPSGVYFYRLQAGSFVETKKMILMK